MIDIADRIRIDLAARLERIETDRRTAAVWNGEPGPPDVAEPPPF